jgi:hypothetical protein
VAFWKISKTHIEAIAEYKISGVDIVKDLMPVNQGLMIILLTGDSRIYTLKIKNGKVHTTLEL